MEELEKLLALLQAYGVTEYSDSKYKLSLVHLEQSYIDEQDFEISMQELKIVEPN